MTHQYDMRCLHRTQVFSLFNAVTCSSFLKALADAGSGGEAKQLAVAEGGSDAEMEDAEADTPSRVWGGTRWQALCAEAIQNLAAVLPLLSLKNQQDSLRKCVRFSGYLTDRL